MICAELILRRWRSFIQAAIPAAFAATLAACAMVDSEPLMRIEGYQCESGAGAYFLPKTLLQFDVVETTDGADPVYTLKVRKRRVADPRFGFCLDYLAQMTGDDVVTIKKYKDAQILGEVATDAIDESRFILQTLIQTAFVVASGNPKFPAFGNRAFREAGNLIVFKAEVDPFDAERTAEVNRALKDFGFCLVLPGVSFVPERQNTDDYCENRLHRIRRDGAPDLSYRHVSSEGLIEQGRRRGEGGVFYRPRLPHPVHVMVRDTPKVQQWRLGIATIVEMENIAPIINVDVDRTYFAQRKTQLKFDEGMLSNVCVYKGSELLAISYIPLQIVQSVAALPGEILKVRINDSNNQTALVNTERELLRVQQEQIAFLKDETDITAPTGFGEQKKKPSLLTGDGSEFSQAAYLKNGNRTTGDACPPTSVSTEYGLQYEPVLSPIAATGGEKE